jgi:hypothetical protein
MLRVQLPEASGSALFAAMRRAALAVRGVTAGRKSVTDSAEGDSVSVAEGSPSGSRATTKVLSARSSNVTGKVTVW